MRACCSLTYRNCSMWLSTIFAVFIMSDIFNVIAPEYLQGKEDIDSEQIIYEKYLELDKSLKNLISNGVKKALPYVMEAREHLNLSSTCDSNLFTLISELRKLKLSAVKFLDAAGKIPVGFLTGSFNMMGDYDECLSTKVLSSNGNVSFQGKYCLLNLQATLPSKKRKITLNSGLEDFLYHIKNTSESMQFLLKNLRYNYVVMIKYGLCVPSGCSTEDVNKMVKYLGKKYFFNASVRYCDGQRKLIMHTGTIVAVVLFSVAGLLATVGSIIDYYSRKKRISFQKNTARFLMCFSIFTNFPKVISTKVQDTVLTSVFGIRTLSLFFIILLHQYFLWSTYQLNGHALHYIGEIPTFFGQIIFNGFLTTDVFFFLGGLLNTYSRVKIQRDGKRQINSFQIIVHRLWRIYPTYIFSLLLFYLFVNVYGPMATFMKQHFLEPCEKKWWENLLFINNFFDQEETCMVHSWYIAVDMQLFLMSLFTVPVLLKNAKKGIILHIIVSVAGLAASVVWVWYKDVTPSVIPYRFEIEDAQKLWNAYVTTFPHIAPYFTGLISGYILSKWNDLKIPRIYRLFGWPAAAACFVSMLFMTKKWNSGAEFSSIESALYFAFGRFVYTLSVAWLVVCCARGYGGVLNYILSLKIWIPFSRISYMVYMTSLLLQIHYYATLKMTIDIDWMTMIWRHIGDLGVSCLLGLVMVVFIESPFITMEKLIFQKSPRRKGVSENDAETVEKSVNGDGVVREIELVKNEKNMSIQLNK